MSKIFRKSALDRLSSPEQLDQIMRVTSPASWAALLSGVLLIAMALVWGFWGVISTKVKGEGILIEQGALFDVIAMGNGQLFELMTDVGNHVHAGQIVARINQPGIMHDLAEAKRTLIHLQTEEQFTEKMGSDILSSSLGHIEQQRRSLRNSIKLSKANILDLEEQLKVHAKLLRDKLVAKKSYLDIKVKCNEERQKLYTYQQELAALPTSRFKASSDRKKKDTDIDLRIIKAEEDLAAIKDQLLLASEVVSPKSGTVNEVFKAPGEHVEIGEPLFSLELDSHDDNIYVLAYFAPDQGSRIRAGMTMQVAVSAAKREEYGVMLAEVVSTSAFPATTRGMMRVLKNEKLVELLSHDAPPIKVRARLIKDASTFSGFKWTSGEGAEIKPKSGTMCKAEVVVKEQRPISLVIPFLKRNLLGVGDVN